MQRQHMWCRVLWEPRPCAAPRARHDEFRWQSWREAASYGAAASAALASYGAGAAPASGASLAGLCWGFLHISRDVREGAGQLSASDTAAQSLCCAVISELSISANLLVRLCRVASPRRTAELIFTTCVLYKSQKQVPPPR